MANPVTDLVAEHDARYGEEGAGAWRVPGSLGSRRRGGYGRTGTARGTKKDGTDLGAEARLTWGDARPKGFEPRRCCVTGSADRLGPADYLSDRFGELGERRGDPQCGRASTPRS
jgi:hypothetical protein